VKRDERRVRIARKRRGVSQKGVSRREDSRRKIMWEERKWLEIKKERTKWNREETRVMKRKADGRGRKTRRNIGNEEEEREEYKIGAKKICG
jgi:hypothetical protein